LVTDMGWDAYGPYQIGEYGLLIRDFPDLQPLVLWDENLASIKHLEIYAIYEQVEWKIAGVGCHTMLISGNPIQGLKKYCVKADGKVLTEPQIDELITEFAIKSEALYRNIRLMDFEQLKQKIVWQELYQLKNLMEAAGLNWEPDEILMKLIKNQPLLKNIFPHGRLINTVREFKTIFGFEKFEKELKNCSN